jgi:3-hydroxy-9,10-secoandrosta-1,3,5(10)-triene-9,17-dione monooxygenase
MYLFGASHALVVATLFDRQAQDDLFAGGDFICPAVVAPAGHAEPAPGGGWTISGTWNYCSGSPYATHFLAHTLVAGENGGPPRPLLFVIPRDQWTRLDDWGGQLGLRGSGSHSIVADAVHVPAWRALDGVHLSQTSVTGGTPGRILHGNPEYGGGPLSFTLLELGALAVGMAQGALDTYEELMRSRTTIYPPIVARTEDPYYQVMYGQAAGKIAAADAALRGAVAEWSATAARGPAAVTRESEWRLSTISREAIRLAWEAVEGHLFPTAGSSAVRRGERMERVWRDMSMLHSHGGVAIVLASMANHELARSRFGA